MTKPPPAGEMDPRYNCFKFLRYLCSPVKTSVAHNFTCLYGPTENVQNEATILTAQRKYIPTSYFRILPSLHSD